MPVRATAAIVNRTGGIAVTEGDENRARHNRPVVITHRLDDHGAAEPMSCRWKRD